MRISVKKDDPGYHPLAHKCQPYLNGEKLRHCFTADEEKGEVFVYMLDENGKHFLNKDKTEIMIERKTGTVTVEKPKDME
jgi:hypothetical protein